MFFSEPGGMTTLHSAFFRTATAFFRTVTAVALASAFLLTGCGNDPGGFETDKNVLLIVADALRADHLGCYGCDAPTSPHIDRVAEQGVLFEDCCTVMPTTLPSFISLLTSRHPKDHGSYKNGLPPMEGLTYVSHVFQKGGRETAFFIASYCLSPQFGTDRGIEHFDDRVDRTVSLPVNRLIRSATSVTDAFLGWYAGRDRERPFFTVVHYFDPHFPYLPPQEHVRRFHDNVGGPTKVRSNDIVAAREHLKALGGVPDERISGIHDFYKAEISYMDGEIGRIMKALDDAGEAGETIVVFTADHGETLWEHDDYFSHYSQVYESNIRIPLILRCPGLIPPGRRESVPFSNIDIAPTLLGLVGGPVPEEFAGVDLHRVVLGEEQSRKDDFLFSEAYVREGGEEVLPRPNYFSSKCVKKGPWKYIWTPHRNNLRELYNWVDDPMEQQNLADDADLEAVLKNLEKTLYLWSLEFTTNNGKPAEISPEVLRNLEALGYGR
jgi:arylsulfatase A-like enzyme